MASAPRPAPIVKSQAPEEPRESDLQVRQAREDEKQRARALRGYRTTILNGPQGLSQPPVTLPRALQGNLLLGQ